MHVGDRRDLAANADMRGHDVRARSLQFDTIAWRLSVDVEKKQGPRRHKAAAGRRSLEPALHAGGPVDFNIRAAVTQPAAGRIIAGPETRELVADIQKPIPIGQPHFAINAELQQLDPVDVPLNGVGINLRVGIVCGVTAVAIKGEAALVARLAGHDAIEGAVVRIDLFVRSARSLRK